MRKVRIENEHGSLLGFYRTELPASDQPNFLIIDGAIYQRYNNRYCLEPSVHTPTAFEISVD